MSFPKLPEEIASKMGVLNAIANKYCGDKMKDLYLRLKRLRTEAFKRATSWRNVGDQYAATCGCCAGSGHYHYCINPYCVSDNEFERDDCLHFTPHEMGQYDMIRVEYVMLLREALDLLKTGIDVSSIMTDSPKQPHDMN